MPRTKIIALGLLATCLAQGASLKLASQLRGLDPNSTVDVIVQYRRTPTVANHDRAAAAGGLLLHSLPSIRAAHYSITAQQLEQLSEDPDVLHISPDHELRATATTPTIPDYGWMTALGISSPTATLPWDGTGISVAVIDSGINTSSDLQDANGKSRIIYQKSFVPNDTATTDAYGHGTMVAGLIAGNGKQSITSTATYVIRGTAPNVNLINLRVLNSSGSASDSTVIAAIQAAIQLATQYKIRVINLSLGRPVFENCSVDPLCQAVQQAWNAGIIVVAAAGNDGRNNTQGTQGYATIYVPGNSPYAITVGAMNTVGTLQRFDDKMTSYSSKGPTLMDHYVKPDLVAPGNRMYSLQAQKSTLVNTYSNNRVAWSSYDSSKTSSPSPAYFELSGTSFAAPLVSGAAALMLQQNPALTPDQVKARLMKTAAKLPAVTTVAVDPSTGVAYYTQNDIFTVGAGYLDVAAALANKDLATAPALSPIAVPDTKSNNVFLVSSQAAVWGSNTAWGTAAVWGSAAIWGTNTIWGSAAVWGSNAAWGTSAIWGSNAAWGTGTTDAAEAATIAVNGEN